MNQFLTKLYASIFEPFLPRKVTTVNGVKTRKHRVFRSSAETDYEQESVDAIRSYVEPDDTVLILGGGWGVTTVRAARSGSEVIVYEAAVERVETIREAVELNEVADSVDVRQGIVGEAKRTLGDHSASEVVTPDALPECDVLEMDIEGSELYVLEEMDIDPRIVIVESHADRDASADSVKKLLREREYSIVETIEETESIATITAVKSGTAETD